MDGQPSTASEYTAGSSSPHWFQKGLGINKRASVYHETKESQFCLFRSHHSCSHGWKLWWIYTPTHKCKAQLTYFSHLWIIILIGVFKKFHSLPDSWSFAEVANISSTCNNLNCLDRVVFMMVYVSVKSRCSISAFVLSLCEAHTEDLLNVEISTVNIPFI